LEASRTHKTPVSSSSITAVLKRIIAENGRDHVKGYIFAVLCLAVVALTTAFTAWIMETVVNEAFANQRADIVWLIMWRHSRRPSCCDGLAGYGQAVTLSKMETTSSRDYQRRLFSHLNDAFSSASFSERVPARTHLAAQISQNINGIRDLFSI